MFKYHPSVVKNNQIKEDFLKSAKALIYKVERGKINPNLSKDEIKEIFDNLKTKIDKFENTLGTGKENILLISNEANKTLKELNKKINQELISQVEDNVDELIYCIDTWKDVNEGSLELSKEDLTISKISWTRKKLLARLEELETFKQEFASNNSRLEKDIVGLEKNINELHTMMIKEQSNERRIEEIYRKIKTSKSKLDSLNIRKSNYNACFDLLDLIHANGKEIISASEYSSVDLAKAKSYLNLNKIKAVFNDPNKTLSVLKTMERDISEMANRTKLIDTKIRGVDSGSTTISAEALAYKEELMRKEREKESLKSLDEDVEYPDKITKKETI